MPENTTNNNIVLSEVQINNEAFLHIANVDKMRPFFMSIVSDSNHWMFIGSNGGISAGRKDTEYALFPYYTDDKIIESAEITGSKSIFRVDKDGETHVWEPFSIRYATKYNTTGNLYKSLYGNKVIFEEVNHDLGLTYQYQWASSDKYGFVKEGKLRNNTQEEISVTLLDGIQNIMPYGVESATQIKTSNLVDAYKRSELDSSSGIGIFALSAIIVDKAEPSEALKANTVWSHGLDTPKYLLSSIQLESFRKGLDLAQEEDVKAEKGAYFISDTVSLIANGEKSWMLVGEVNQQIADVVSLAESIKNDAEKLVKAVEKDVQLGTKKLIALNASSDSQQLSNDRWQDARHFSNTLFNIMRGGIFDNDYQIERKDFADYLSKANKEKAKTFADVVNALPTNFSLSELIEASKNANDTLFERLCKEYLPLKFSRRHGDPSRPWNRFSINTADDTGKKILDYEGNWRDIFQNWEALAHAYPEFIDGMIFRFLNASTFDGYNPYRITKNGIDWERIEPDDPWSYIGYWGDHQIIYLQKFLEFAESHYPGKLESYFNQDLFVYANVPYRIKPYQDLLANPKDTIDFDEETDHAIMNKWPELGADSVLLASQKGNIIQVNFVEKILATLLAKMSNFIPEGGIWMNTQRPEWNDANNALVGNGVSMVTLYYMIRFLNFAQRLFNNTEITSIPISTELNTLFEKINTVLNQHKDRLSGSIDDKKRKQVMDGLGQAASNFRESIYANSFKGEKVDLAIADVTKFSALCSAYLEHSLNANKRTDNMYHAYNIMTVENEEEVSISYLSEMLEGQVAVLSSGILPAEEVLSVLDGMKSSALFRPDQYSYLLYPEKQLPGFFQKNNIPNASVEKSSLLKKMLEDDNKKIIERDIKGVYHFNGNFRNAGDLAATLDELASGKYADLAKAERKQLLKIFEDVFNHKAFTGRSGTFFGFEGLGSIYWHMVSKLALAVQECCLSAIREGADEVTVGKLLEHYYEINAGIGVHKSPELYGAFPTDPYSHTPKTKGAQQPGMTGQVKEDILCRMGELGVLVKEGKLTFSPDILKKDEFLQEAKVLQYIAIGSKEEEITVEKDCLCFTYCQVPVVYQIADASSLEVTMNNGEKMKFEGLSLNESVSDKIFQRSGEVSIVHVMIDKDILK